MQQFSKCSEQKRGPGSQWAQAQTFPPPTHRAPRTTHPRHSPHLGRDGRSLRICDATQRLHVRPEAASGASRTNTAPEDGHGPAPCRGRRSFWAPLCWERNGGGIIQGRELHAQKRSIKGGAQVTPSPAKLPGVSGCACFLWAQGPAFL